MTAAHLAEIEAGVREKAAQPPTDAVETAQQIGALAFAEHPEDVATESVHAAEDKVRWAAQVVEGEVAHVSLELLKCVGAGRPAAGADKRGGLLRGHGDLLTECPCEHIADVVGVLV